MRTHPFRGRLGSPQLLAFFVLALCPALLAGRALAVPGVGFPYRVASGEVTSTSAVLWTRVDTKTPIKAEVATDPFFHGSKAFKQEVMPSPAQDLTIRVRATGLEPATTYYYRFRHGSAQSAVGTFRTAPAAASAADVSFAFSADSDYLHQFVDGNTFQVLDAVRSEPGLDFFVYLGDTIYSDSSLRPLFGLSPAAVTLNEYRDVYRSTRALSALQKLLQSVSTYAVADDHEVQNDYDGQTVDPTRYANGRQAFTEYMPLLEDVLPADPTCAGAPLYRTFRWGSEVDVFVLDERSCRSADVQAACATSPFTVDLAPTLPPAIRGVFRAQLLGAGVPLAQVDLLLPAAAAPACLAAIGSPARTVLGPVQKAALKAALQASTAPFKVIVNEYPIQQFWALPYDRWEGYAAERGELLAHIRDFVSGRVLFVTTDTHANLINTQVAVDRLGGGILPLPVATEVVAGPIATFTFEQELGAFAAGLGLPPAFVVASLHQLFSIGGVQCRNINVDAYARVDVSASAGTATVAVKNASGSPVLNSNPFDPFNLAACALTIGP